MLTDDLPIRGDAEPLTVAPILHVPNIEEVQGTDGVNGISRYSLRPLAVLGPEQWMVVPDALLPVAAETLAYLRDRGLPVMDPGHLLPFEHPREGRFCADVQADGARMRHLATLCVERCEPFCCNPAAGELAARLHLPLPMPVRVAGRWNHKAHARAALAAWNVPTPGGVLLRDPDAATVLRCVQGIRDASGCPEVALTRPESCSGVGIRRVRTDDDVVALLESDLRGVPELLVEPWLPGVLGSPSFQVWLGETPAEDRLVAVTDQLLRDDGQGPLHLGNLIPTRFGEVLRPELRRIVNALRAGGLRGLVGVDLIVRETASGHEVRVVEVNARQTGALYGAILAHRVSGGRPHHAYVHNNVKVPPGTTLGEAVSALERAGIHWRPGASHGVLVTCAGALDIGKLMVVAVGESRARVEELIEATRCAPYESGRRGAA